MGGRGVRKGKVSWWGGGYKLGGVVLFLVTLEGFTNRRSNYRSSFSFLSDNEGSNFPADNDVGTFSEN